MDPVELLKEKLLLACKVFQSQKLFDGFGHVTLRAAEVGSSQFRDRFLNSLAPFLDVFEGGGVGEADMFVGAEVFARDRGDFGFFEQIIGHVAGSLELLARGGLAEEFAHVGEYVECALGF